MAAVMLAGLSGCFNMTPDYHRPALDIRQPESFRNASVSGPALLVDDPWWREFGNPEIDKMVEEVLHRNWDVRLAAARILEAGWNVTRVRADRFPSIGLQGTADRRKIGGPRVESGLVFNTLETSVPATFELDLWGRLAAAEKAARYDLLMEEENRRTVAHTVIAETVKRYFEMEAIERRLQITRQSIAAFVRSLDFVQRRYRHGLSSVLAVRQARRILAEAEAIIPDLQQQLGSIQQQIAVLLGRYPSTRPEQVRPEDYFKRLPPVPAGLTSELLQRRPDIRAAEARLKAANERIGAAKAARFPAITLTGRYGYSSDELNSLINPASVFWNLTAGLTQPLFDAGKLKA
ncbi:MAG TPA: efflux transporter outer membrane subunit, partial [Armatimonadetes bacterium]|nr:efflux transporter outer membrane subunit [Armatimonadota bacterium]